MAAPSGIVHGEGDTVKAWLRAKVPHVVRELVAGGAAGAVAKTCVAPLERTKILLMTGRSRGSALSTLRLIVASEGVRGLFRGNAASCLRIMPYAAIHFSVYEAYRRMLAEHWVPTPAAAVMGATGTGPPGGTAVGSAGAGGGATTASSSAGGPPPVRSVEQLPTSSRHLGEDVPPTPMSSSIDVSATAVITTVEEEQREEEEEEEQQELRVGPPSPVRPRAAVPPEAPEAAVAAPRAQKGAAAAPHSLHHSDHQHHQHQHQRQRLGPILDLFAGSAAGATAVILTYPLDVIRTRMAWAMDGSSRRMAGPGAAAAPAISVDARAGGSTASAAVGEALSTAPAAGRPVAHHTRIRAMLVHTVRHEGLQGLYRGLAPTLYGIMPYAGLKFFVYGSLKQLYRDSLHPPSAGAAPPGGQPGAHGHAGGERLSVPYMLAFGGASGLLAQTVTYPLDVIRRRMQVYGIQQEAAAEAGAVGASAVQRLTTWAMGGSIVRQEGARGLFRGLSLNYVKVVPSTAIGFTVYDIFKSYLGVTGNM